jgi:NAD(P)-dependent dehydrogenase (short-subunit alcohol dehydrogenase family)
MEDTTLADARYQFEVNLFGMARLTQLALPAMREKRAGKIVNISSMGGRIYTPLGSWYHATKHAVEGWSDCLRVELAPFGIDVIIIEPGIIRTEFGEVLMGPMLERSGETAYSGMAQAVAKWTRVSHESGAGSPPSTVAETIAKALRARRPRTRYVVGSMARPMMWVRKWMGDRVFDKVLASRL